MSLIHTCCRIQASLRYKSNTSNRLSGMKNTDPRCLRGPSEYRLVCRSVGRGAFNSVNFPPVCFYTKQKRRHNQLLNSTYQEWAIINHTANRPLRCYVASYRYAFLKQYCVLTQPGGNFLVFVDSKSQIRRNDKLRERELYKCYTCDSLIKGSN